MNSATIRNPDRAWRRALPAQATIALFFTALALAGNASGQTATLTDIGSAPPTPGADDVSQLVMPSGANKPDGLNYYVDNATPPGQTFTTGSNPSGYTLNSLAIATAGDSGGGIPGSGQAYALRLYSVSGTTATLMATYTSAANFTFTDLDWLQWTGISLALQPNAQYAYSFARTSFGWENLANVAGNFYAGGEVALIPTGGGTMSLGSSHGYDASFHVGLTAVTTIAVNPPIIAPQNAVPRGTAVTISTAPAVGAPPLHYQWQTDGGSGGTLTNIPAATSTTLAVNTTGMAPGSYQYAVVVTNNTSAATSAVSVLAVYQLSGAALSDVGASISPEQYDLSQLTGGGDGDGLNYYSDNNNGPGQTFTTGNNPQGYYLASVTIGTGGGTSGHTAELRDYELRIFSVNSSTATLLANYTNANFSFNYGDWLEWSGFTPLFLKPNTTYAYAFRKTNLDGWAGMTTTPVGTDLYAGGQIGLIPQNGGPIAFGSTGTSDAAFDLGLLPVGLPTVPLASPIVVSPAQTVPVGTSVTLSEAATGVALHYIWQSDGGTGGAFTSLPANDATNLVLNTTGWTPGVYQYDVIVTNTYGSVTSSVVNLTVTYADTTGVLADIGTADPLPLVADDVAQLLTGGGKPDGLNYYVDNSPAPGQTFLTGSNPNGYTLTTLAVRTAGDSGSLPAAGQAYQLRVYSVSGGNAVLYATYTSQTNFTFTDLDWLRWSGLDLPLVHNTTYAYSFGRISTGSGWENMGNTAGNPCVNGEVALIPAAGGAMSFGGSHDYDATFVVGLAVAGYPKVAPAVCSPTNIVYAGTPVTIHASVTGTGSFTYQWQTDGGNAGNMANIPGANGPTLSVDTAGLGGLTVAYRLVASNGSGSTTGEATFLTVSPASPPIVVSPYTLPENNVAIIGGTVTLRVSEAGTLPLTNQWTFNGVNLADNGRITGAQSGVLVITNVQSSDAGYYQVNITNGDGSYNVYPGGGADQKLTVIAVPTFFTNGLGWVANGSASIVDNVLTLSAGTGSDSSFFFNAPVYIGAFRASFTYQDAGGGGADGFTFCVQNQGASALGGGGGGLGVSGIAPSAELTFNIYNTPGMSFGTNGGNGSPYNSTDPVNIASGDPIAVSLLYRNGMLQVNLSDATAGTTLVTNLPVGSLPAVVGGATAYMGFTGASGGVGSQQTITGFSYVPLTALAGHVAGSNLVLAWPLIPGGYVLQSTSSLSSPNWQTVAATVNQVAGQNEVAIPAAPGNLFYRLVVQVPPQ